MTKIAKFSSVGALGSVSNITVFSALTLFNLNYNLASTLAFMIAVTQNYQLNKKWTFKDHNTKTRKKFVKYFILNFIGFLINLFVLNLVVMNFGDEKMIRIIGQIVGIGVAMGFNFLGSYLIIFAKHVESKDE